MNAIGTASGLAISVGIIGVAVYTGAAGADYRATSSTDSCTPSSSTSAPSSPVATTTEPTAPTTTASEETSTSAPETSTPTSTPDSCSNPPASDDPTTTTTVVQPRGTTQPPDETESGGGGSVDKTLTPPATGETLASGGDSGRSGDSGSSVGGIGGSASGLPGPHADQVPRPGEVPGGSLPNQNVPVLGTHVPDFGLLGPDPKSLTAASMSSGDAEALPSPQPALGNAELLAVSALAMVVGLLARTLAVRPLRVRIRRNDGDI